MAENVIVVGGDRPPSYDAVDGNRRIPPAFTRYYGDFRQASDPMSLAQVLCAASIFACGTVVCSITLCILSLIPLGMLVLGFVNRNNCPEQHLIPIWLIVFGAVCLFDSLIRCCCRCMCGGTNEQSHDGHEKTTPKFNAFSALVNFFLIVWIIIGSFWIYGSFGAVQHDKLGQHYCDGFTYIFSFIFVSFIYGFALLACFLVCCFCCCALCCMQRPNPMDQYPTI